MIWYGTLSADALFLGSDMPYLKPKTKAGSAWLPSQVEYGMDCSDPDPANWKPFGRIADELAAKKVERVSATQTKSGPPTQ